MEISIGILITLGIILIFLLGTLFGLAFDQENNEELKKIRMRKTKEYKLGFREAREFYLKKPLEIEEVSAEDFWHKVEIENLKSEKNNLMRTLEEAQEKIMKLENELFELEEENGISRDHDKN